MNINRQELLDSIYQFALNGSGLIVGKPGIGKSYILRKLKERLLKERIVCLIIRIDNAFDFSDEAIASELNLKTGEQWIDILSKIKLLNNHKAVLVFDAFDAARDEQKRVGFLNQIKKAKKLLKEKWNIVVSVRTYDASKSAELMKIFPVSINNPGFASRQLEVSNLTSDEIEGAITDSEKIKRIYELSSDDFRDILKVPFFLRLLEIVTETSGADELIEFSAFNSETQILKAFWEQKIVNTDQHIFNEKFLQMFTERLIENKVLSYPKSDLLYGLTETEINVFKYLRSEDIIDEISHNNSRVAYSHNILFDYAISRVSIDASYDGLMKFINDDNSRPFFFRPSFIYFFTSLWYSENDTFWELYLKMAKNNQKEIQLFVRLILTATIVSEFSTIEDIKPVLQAKEDWVKLDGIRNILQSIRFLRNEPLKQDVELLSYLSLKLDNGYLFEFAFLLDRSINNGELRDYGLASRNLLRYVLNNRDQGPKHFLDRIGSGRGVELVAKTYFTDKAESEKLLLTVLEMVHEPGFEISYITNIAENIKYILSFDPQFVAKVYKAIFGYTETSSEKTSMGNSVIMNFISDRKQDFEMCYYRLQIFFPIFQAEAPDIAIPTVLDIINNRIRAKKVYEGTDKVTFEFNGQEHSFLADYSSIWAEGRFSTKTQEMTQEIITFIEDLIKGNEVKNAKKFINILISKAEVGYLWKQIFLLIGKFPEQLVKDYFGLLVVPELMSASETSFEVREIIRKANHLLSDDQIKEIEDVAIGLYKEERLYTLQMILSTIPKERLQVKYSKEFMKDKEQISNTPGYSFSSSVTTYTTEDWLEDKGVDLSSHINKPLLETIKNFEQFNNQYLNNKPEYTNYSSLIPIAKSNFRTLAKLMTDEPVLAYSLLSVVAKFASIITKDIKSLLLEEYNFVKEVIFYSIAFYSESDKLAKDMSPAHGYSPTPRIDASEGIIDLFTYNQDKEVSDMFEPLISDPNSVVRFNIIRNLQVLANIKRDLYDGLFMERLKNENDSFVYAALLGSLIHQKKTVREEAVVIIQTINLKVNLFTYNNQFLDAYTDLLFWYLTKYDIAEAFQTLMKAYKWPDFCNTVIFKLFKDIRYSISFEDIFDSSFCLDKKIAIINQYLDNALNEITKIKTENIDLSTKEWQIPLKIIDEIILRIYFSLEPERDGVWNQETWLENRRKFYFTIKPIYNKVLKISGQITSTGIIIGHTAYYLVQSLNTVFSYDAKEILHMMALISKYSVKAGYTFDQSSIREIIKLTEKLLSDHRDILLDDDSFQDMILILDVYINSGWVEALELLWKLDEIFK